MKTTINDDWQRILKNEFKKDYFKKLAKFLTLEYKTDTIYPVSTDIFNSINIVPIEKTKAVIIGQDPYHGKNQAHGLSFSVKKGIRIPPSLQNIYKEMRTDVGKSLPDNGDLTYLANQGVLLLNSILTVKKGQPGSHSNIGWEIFTDSIVSKIAEKNNNVVFILWGAYAQNKIKSIDKHLLDKHLILKAPHPSPFSAYKGFFGCRHFSKTNDYLTNNNVKPIDW